MKQRVPVIGRMVSRVFKGGVASLVLLALASTAQAQSAPLTPEQERAVQKLIIKTIKERPELILEAVRALDARNKQSEEELVQRILKERSDDIFNNPNDPVGGNPDGDITLVEFFDYRCGYCKKVHPSVMKLLKEDGNIRYVYKEFPILGPDSVYAAEAALASRPQGKYQAFSKALMESRGSLDKPKVLTLAKKTGLDVAALENEIKGKKSQTEKVFQENYKLAQELNITGTPGFVIGDMVIRGAINFEALKMVVAQNRKMQKEN